MRLSLALATLAACAHPPTGPKATSSIMLEPQIGIHVLHSFVPAEGIGPRAGVIVASDGMVWGTLWQSGPFHVDPPGGHCNSTGTWSTDYQKKLCPGSVFRMSLDGSTFQIVHGFGQLDASYKNDDGYQPAGQLLDAGDGWVYGTTTKGGRPPDLFAKVGVGGLFRINIQTLEYQWLYSFCSLKACVDGAYPYDGLTSDGAGHLIVHTKAGGSGGSGGIAILDTATLTVRPLRGYAPVTYVRDATGKVIGSYNADGGNPFGGPVVGTDHALHAWLPGWGPKSGGTIVTVAMDGTEVVNTVFDPIAPKVNADNAALLTMIVSRVDGRMIGFRPYSGPNTTGEMFQLEPDGSGYTALYDFPAAPVNTPTGHYANVGGAVPLGTPVEDDDGTLVASTYYGGYYGQGTAIRASRAGVVVVLHEFKAAEGICYPSSGFTKASGHWLGVSMLCGAGGGTVFDLVL